jgi:hypothetical protein
MIVIKNQNKYNVAAQYPQQKCASTVSCWPVASIITGRLINMMTLAQYILAMTKVKILIFPATM